jgi:hypothetical protein
MLGKRPLEEYIRRPPEQLFDMDNDLLELDNIADNANHADVLEELRGRLEEWQELIEDLWLFRDGVSVTDLKVHLGDETMVMPDRFDFDPTWQSLKGKDVKVMTLKGDPKGIRGGTMYASNMEESKTEQGKECVDRKDFSEKRMSNFQQNNQL